MWLVLAAAVSVAAPDVGTVKHVQLSVDGERGIATLSFAIKGSDAAAKAASLVIDVPHGSRVIGMSATIGGRTADAKPMPVAIARQRFHDFVEGNLDPALLELASTSDATDQLRLHVFPLAVRSSARVELTIELPAVDAVELRAPSRATVELDGRRIKGRTLRLPARTWMSADPARREAVSATVAFLAEEDPPVPDVVVFMPRADVPWCGVTRL